jgi:hypothetical protein
MMLLVDCRASRCTSLVISLVLASLNDGNNKVYMPEDIRFGRYSSIHEALSLLLCVLVKYSVRLLAGRIIAIKPQR